MSPWREALRRKQLKRNANKSTIFRFHPIWRWDKWPCAQITPGCWQRCKCRNTNRKPKEHFEENDFGASCNPHGIYFPLMLHRWCPCCQLGWRIICIIHQKPGVDLTLKEFSVIFWQTFSGLRFDKYSLTKEHPEVTKEWNKDIAPWKAVFARPLKTSSLFIKCIS